ncbi:cytoplasmic dynein 2 light intermediate chain 1 isoform X2 [Zootermopsis nevadensis]|uniref:cytoplasmic dynein 2 light intermediate chain 1 isoform X2 n=1 Tax=Zootermopsis nevadensis TaxID=136037 RepID=UPI000B8EC6B1|nr:cytoplasmic dynein 2 light intermediate chain 1 isoform X2 [Zootermopsis nevadensis]
MNGKDSLWDIAVRISNEQQNTQPSSGSQPKERTVLILGSKGVGKTSLIHRFLDRNEGAKQTLALEYTFGRRAGKSLVKDICHIWELGGGTLYPSLLTAPLAAASNDLSHLTVILMLDLAVPQQLWFTLETLIQNLHAALRKQASALSGKDAGQFIQKLQEEAWKRVGRENEDKEYMDPFPVPLVILGGKYDIFQDFDSEKKKVVCRCLRYVAHTLGATLQFYSLKDSGLVKKAKDLLNHHGFGAPPGKSISQDYNKPLLIPAGSDSNQQIGGLGATRTGTISKGPGAAIDRWKHIFTTHFPQETSEKSVMPEDPAKDLNFQEPIIDSLRAQKDDELERYRQIAERRRHFQIDTDDI